VIRDGGIGVAPSLAAFAEAFEVARAAAPAAPSPETKGLPPGLQAVLDLGMQRLTDYQDAAYARRYRERIGALQAVAGSDAASLGALEEAARQLALWMSYEDIVRVADLKTRASRLARVREEAMAGPDDIVEIREHLRPGLDEIAAVLPPRIGLALRARVKRGQPAGTTGRSMTLTTTSIHGFALLRLLASMRRLRPISLRFGEEQAAIGQWLQAMTAALPRHAGFARALAELPRLRKGYSDTFERGRAGYERIFAARVEPVVVGGRFDDAAAQAPSRRH
jgi:indolepyruvate ferredoxin oxidoreductase beta subunit